ncbi:histidine phosphatase family protein [Nocardia sp. NBC_01388]|uniref:histidine phosphatase family protein n=1 Tax=Nocardia sp. NBC_01388 TaxID=2903596 RepID=UPI003868EADA
MTRRVILSRDKPLTQHAGRTVLIVSHIAPLRTRIRLALGAPHDSLFRMELAAASVSEVAYYSAGNPALRLLNDTSHLR